MSETSPEQELFTRTRRPHLPATEPPQAGTKNPLPPEGGEGGRRPGEGVGEVIDWPARAECQSETIDELFRVDPTWDQPPSQRAPADHLPPIDTGRSTLLRKLVACVSFVALLLLSGRGGRGWSGAKPRWRDDWRSLYR